MIITTAHDHIIEKYQVNFKDKTLVVETRYFDDRFPENMINEKTDIVFSQYLTHVFGSAMSGTVIFDIKERPLSHFLKSEKITLEISKSSAWPMWYETEEELCSFLQENEFKAFHIGSSYGLNGWVIAKNMELITTNLTD